MPEHRRSCKLEATLDRLVRSKSTQPSEILSVLRIVRGLLQNAHALGVEGRANAYRIEATTKLCVRAYWRTLLGRALPPSGTLSGLRGHAPRGFHAQPSGADAALQAVAGECRPLPLPETEAIESAFVGESQAGRSAR